MTALIVMGVQNVIMLTESFASQPLMFHNSRKFFSLFYPFCNGAN